MRVSSRAATAGVIAALLLVTGCESSDAGATTNVEALWYGSMPDGSPAGGVTEVTVGTSHRMGRPFSVDLEGLHRAGTGAAWNAAAWSAATLGMLGTGRDPRGWRVDFGVREAIDGPSAGALLTTAVVADLTGATVRSDATLTGTVLPSGAVGPVGGLPEKVRAAADAGMRQVYIPAGQRLAVDPRTRKKVDVVVLGESLGIQVTEVASVREAAALLLTPAPPTATRDQSPEPTDPAVDGLMRRVATETTARLAQLPAAPAPLPAYAGDAAEVANGRTAALQRVPELLGEGRVIEAFARATLAERVVAMWNARAAAVTGYEADPQATNDSLVLEATSVRDDADDAIESDAAVAVASVEQLTALADTLCWAVDAWAVGAQVSDKEGAPTSSREAGDVAARLAAARFDLRNYLPVGLQAMADLGDTPLVTGRSTQILAAYASVVAQAAEANLDHVRATVSAGGYSTKQFDTTTAELLAAQWRYRSGGGEDASQVVAATATALSYFVETSALVAAGEASSGVGTSLQLANQIEVAAGETAVATDALRPRGVDVSYLVWNEDLGRTVATAPDAIGADGAIRTTGLQWQWYGNMQGRMLAALTEGGWESRPQPALPPSTPPL